MINHFKYLFFLLLLFVSVDTFATHNRAGEIIYDQIGPLTIRATIVTYTKASSTAADRDSLTLFWGDGSFENVGRSNGMGSGEVIPGQDLKVNFYIAEHTYPGRATYTLSFTDPNRVSDIVNLNFPNSVDIQFYVQTTFTLLNTQFQGLNSSARLLQPPIDNACIFKKFEHNPNAYDPDGDSLAYELIVPFEGVDLEVPNYLYPNQISPGTNNVMTLNEVTGDFVWNAPQLLGEYSIALLIKEYRNGVLINRTVRDMQIFVGLCENEPPMVESIEEICVVAGTSIRFPISIDDPDENQLVLFSFTGGPFELDYFPARILEATGEYEETPDTVYFEWDTKCEHVQEQYYQMVLKAKDRNNPDINSLSDLQTVRIKVVAPPPENLEAIRDPDGLRLEWDKPYACETTQDSFFLGFSVWRRKGSNPFDIDTCINGLDGKGYEKISFQTNQFENDKYFYIDNQLPENGIYCYRVLAQFAPRTENGIPFNVVESLASNEVCIQLDADIPLITNVSVVETDPQGGSIVLKWIKSDPLALDTIENPGPYSYRIMHSEDDGISYTELNTPIFQHQNFSDSIDLTFLHNNIDTENKDHFYKIDFYVNGQYYGTSEQVSSVFLSIQASDAQNILSWTESVPWQNYEYHIYRRDPNAMVFDSLTRVFTNTHTDRFLMNGDEYCYYIKAFGTYGLPTIPDPLINDSQFDCSVPIDIVAPCAPRLTVTNPCDDIQDGTVIEEFFNTLNWTNPQFTCEMSMDVEAFNIYFSNGTDIELELLHTTESNDIFTFQDIPELNISGCYAVSAIDSLGNESELSNVVCVSNCPVYKLPNTITPNGDGANEIFVPLENRFVDFVDFKLYNRWGNLIYETDMPNIEWDGKDLKGKMVDDGVYYYSCIIFDRDLNGQTKQSDILSGFIQVIKN